MEWKYRQKFGIIKKNNKNLNPFENSKEYKFGISVESQKFDLDLIKTLIFLSNFGMQISANIWIT